MWKTDVYRLGIKTMVIVAVSAMVFAVFAGMNTQNVKAEDFEGNVQVSGDYGYEPDIAVDSIGNIYVVWEHYGIWCKNSIDYGASFGTAIFVSGTDLYCDYPSIAVDANDNLHVAWIGSGDYIYYAKSTDHGASFSEGYNLSLSRSINGAAFENIQVNDVDGSVSGDPAIAISTGEIIYVVWQASGGRTRIATSINQGASFGVSVRVDDMGDFSTYYPSVAAIGTSTVYVAWGDTDSGRLRVSKSIDSGASFGSSVIVSDADVLGDIWSSIAVHPCGKIFVAWAYDKTSGDDIGMEIYFANSTDEGGSFGTNIKVNDAPPTASYSHKWPSLAVGNDTEVYVAWKDHRGDHNRIWFSKAPDATWPSKITDLDAVDATANSITLNWTAPGDNFDLGTAAEYDIRYSTSDITETNWADATQVEGEIEPNITETHESFEVTGLGNDTLYYFAIKTLDERNNTSPLSKVVSRKTLAEEPNLPPTAPVVSGPQAGSKNTDYNYTAVSTDDDNNTLQYTFDWGDGETNTTDLLPNGTTTEQKHTYASAGKYTIQVTANDNKTDSETTTYTVLIDAIDLEYNGTYVGYMTDDNGDGTWDKFHESGVETDADLQDDGTYLIDSDGDDEPDYVYDHDTGELTLYAAETPVELDNPVWLMLGVGLVLSVLVVAGIAFFMKKKKK
jgi:hypothetical protein